MERRSRRIALLLGVLGAVVPLAARAQPAGAIDKARALDKRGTDAFRAGRFDEAIEAYQAAYNLAPRPGGLYNIARAYHKKGDTRRALDYYRRYLAAEPNGPVSAEARDYVADIERSLAAAQPPATEPGAAGPPRDRPPATKADATPTPPDTTVALPATEPAAAPPLTFGPKVGVALARFDVGNDIASNYQVGLAAGAFASYAPSPWLAVRAELLFVQKGDFDPGSEKVERIDYVEVPLLGQVSYVGLFAEAGPYFALKVGSDGTPFDPPGGDAGLVFGAGYAFAAGPGAIVLEARFELGLVVLEPDNSTTNRSFLFSLGYGFR